MRAGVGLSHLCDKAIAASGYRLDAAALLSVLIEDVAQLRDLHVQVGFLDHSFRPDRRHDRVFRDQLPFALDQQAEQTERARPERDWRGHTPLIQPKQTAAATIEAEALEQDTATRTERVHASALRQEGHDP